MQIIAKWLIRLLLCFAVLIAATVTYITVLMDPNDYKQDIEKTALQQGIKLHIPGNIGWQFYPELGLSIGEVQLASASAPNASIISLKKIDIGVKLIPLLQQKIIIKHVLLDGLQAQLQIDKNGKGNWETLISNNEKESAEKNIAAETNIQQAQVTPKTNTLALLVPLLKISNSSITLDNQQDNSALKIAALNFSSTNFKFDQQQILLQKLHLSSSVTIKNAQQSKAIQLNPITISSHDFSMENDTVILEELKLSLPNLNINGNIKASLSEDFSFNGHIAISSDNLKQLLKNLGQQAPSTQDKDVLKTLSLSGDVSGSANQVALRKLQLQLDDNPFSGNIEITDISQQAIVATLQGKAFNADRYLPPSEPSSSAAPKTAKLSTTKSTTKTKAASVNKDLPLIPVELLQGLNTELNLKLSQLIINQLSFENPDLKLSIKNGLLKLKRLNADFYQGNISLQASVDARKKQPSIILNAAIKKVEIHPVLNILADMNNVKGSANIDINITSQGQTQRQLTKALNGKILFSGDSIRLEGENIEEHYCKTMKLLKPELTINKTWPNYSELNKLVMPIKINNGVANITGTQAQVINLQTNGSGLINLNQELLDLNIGATASATQSSQGGCLITSGWKNKAIPLRCKGSFSTVACKADEKAIKRMLKDKAKRSAKEKIKSKLEDKIDDKYKEPVMDLLKKFL